jgi:hypothetical protein
MYPILDSFRGRAVSLYSSKIVDKIEILRTVSNTGIIVQVTMLVQFTKYSTFPKIPQSTSMHFASRLRTWHVACLYSEIALPQKLFRIGRVQIHFFA